MSDAVRTGRQPSGHLEVAREGLSVLLRVIDLGNMNISLTMQDFALSCIEGNYRHFALDLGRCTGMDSTFMGTVVGLNRSIRENAGWLCLLNVSEENLKLLKMLGVLRLVPVREEFPLLAVETVDLPAVEDPERRMALIQAAHLNLVQIDERNRERFGAFLSGLDQEMQRQPSGEDTAEGEGKDQA